MAEFSHEPVPAKGTPRADHIRNEEDLTHVRQGPLGPTAVVPDDYVGPMPAGAIRESDYHRMTKVYGDIESGNSSVQFDTSNFFKNADGQDLSLLSDPRAYMQAIGDAANFKAQYMGYLQDLVKTPAGLQLLEQLDTSKHKTTIERGSGNAVDPKNNDAGFVDRSGRAGEGTDVTVSAAPNLTEWDGENCQHGDQPWMADRPRFAFYHELVHSYHFNRGDNEPDGHQHAQCVTDIPWQLAKKEFQAVGLGPYADNAISENAIRAQMGVPERPTYSGAAWDGPDIWGQVRDAEEPPTRSPAR